MTALLAPLATLPLAFFGVGGTEVIVVLMIVLVLFGGDKMPELARGIGKALRDFKKAASSVEEELKKAMEEAPKKPAAMRPLADNPADDRRFDLPGSTATGSPTAPAPTSLHSGQPLSTRPNDGRAVPHEPYPGASQGLMTGSNAAGAPLPPEPAAPAAPEASPSTPSSSEPRPPTPPGPSANG
ncbi:twin-arginine translocase TatA/TatE family subunit [Nibricoccus sp. IMCC34717]|uniref:twin-arginine translocase TatA/TatE family subunit n=1 Tax=Nibricoccus sp. IMCC34717 TaxID=3034021 RepID=UPI003850ADE8